MSQEHPFSHSLPVDDSPAKLITGVLIQWIGPGWAVVALFVPQGIAALAATLYPPLREAPLLSTMAQKKEEHPS